MWVTNNNENENNEEEEVQQQWGQLQYWSNWSIISYNPSLVDLDWDWNNSNNSWIKLSRNDAMAFCENLVLSWADDWYLPDITELWTLYSDKDTIWGFTTGSYRSSTAWVWPMKQCRYFDDWRIIHSDEATKYFRCIRPSTWDIWEDWACWSDNWWDFSVWPTNLCSVWTPSNQSDWWAWNNYSRTCNWINWWSNASCSATHLQPTLNWSLWSNEYIITYDPATVDFDWDWDTNDDEDPIWTWSEAVNFCNNLELWWKTNWFLPWMNEIRLLYDNKDSIWDFDTVEHYWTSEQTDWWTFWWTKRFSDWYEVYIDKDSIVRMRCVHENRPWLWTDNNIITYDRTEVDLNWDWTIWNDPDQRLERDDALAFCNNLTLWWETEWRLPTLAEAESINDYLYPWWHFLDEQYWASDRSWRDAWVYKIDWSSVLPVRRWDIDRTRWYVRCVLSAN